MKRPIAIGAVIALAAVLGAGAPANRSTTYDVTADTIEGCSCPLFCTCYFGPSADEHMCQADNVYKFRKGSHWGGTDLSDQVFWISLDLGGDWHKKPGPGMATEWAVLTFNKTSTPAQRDAILKVAGTVFPVKWKKFATREDTISWQDDANGSHASMASGLADIKLDKQSTLRPDKAQPVIIKNLQYWFSTSNEGFVLAYSTHRFGGYEGTPKFSWEKRNGFMIAWNARGVIKPETKTALK
jgi:hypothetical protein